MSVETPEGRKVLVQDLPQYEQSVQKSRIERATREEKEYEAAQKEYEKSEKAAEAQYQKELAAYNKQIADAEKLAKQQNKYDAEIQKLEAQKQKELADAHYSVWGPGGSRNRSELNQKQNTIIKNYNSAINKQVEQKRVETGYQEFSIAYPGQVLPRNVAETFRSDSSSSLLGLYEKKVEGKAIQAERKRQSSIQSTQNIAAKQSIEYHSNIPNIGFISSGLGTERGAAVKDLPNAPEGKKAVETRQRLTNVNTGQSIMGGQQASPEITLTRTETYRETPGGPVLVRNVERTIPEKKASKGVPTLANPLAFVASLDRQDVDISGRPIEQKVQPKSNIEILKETLSRYQALTGEQKAPYKTVLESSLTDKGRRIDPISKLFIEQSALKQYSTRAEAFGLVEAKGRKAIIKQDGKQIFDIETGMGDVNIGRKLGFVYDYNLQRPTEEKGVLFEGSLQYVLSPKVQGPQQPKLEEAVGAVGTIEYALAPEPKQTSFNKSLENQYNKLGELQEITQKKAKSGDPRDILVQLAYAPSEAVRSVIGAGGAIVNLFEQTIDPLTEKTLNLKRTARPAPIIFESDVSGTTVLPYDFEAQKWSIPILDKSYELRQREAIEKRGLPAYAFGIGFDYYGLKGAPSLIKVGVKTVPKLFVKLAKPALPRIGRMAKEAALLGSTGKISSPSRMWDVAEPVQKVGLRIERKVQPTWAVQKQQLPVPNPFGKERIIPYYLRQGITKVSDFGKRVIEKPRGLATPIWLKNFSDISLNPAHLGTKPNIPTRAQLEKPPEYKRTYPTLGIMRGIFYPDIPTPRSKAPLIPAGFTKINPKTITVKKSARQIIKLPSLFKSKISIPKLSTPQFVKRGQQQWQGFVFMQKKRIGIFKESLPTFPSLPKPKANQFVTIQRKIRDVKSGILETKRLGLQLFEWPTAKKQIVPAFGKQELKNLTREDIGIPSNIKIVSKKEPRKLSFGIAPSKSPPFMEGFIEKPFRARGKAPIEISWRADVSGLGSVTARPQSFFEMRRRFPSAPVEFGIIPKGTGMDALKGPAAEWSKNWMLKQRKVSSQDYLYRLEKVQGKRQWVEYPLEVIPLEKTKMFYHGTSPEAAEKILKGGFGSKTVNDPYVGVTGDFISDDFEYAAMYSDLTSKGKSGKVLGIKLSKEAKIADLNKIARKIGLPVGEEFQPNIIKKISKFAYEQKYDALNLFDMETVVFNPKIIKISKVFDVTPTGKIIKEYTLPTFRSALPSKATRITSERFRQLPKFDPSWPKPPPPVQGDEFMNQLTALRRQSKGESNMLFSDPRRTSKVNVRMIKNEMEGMGYFKTATPFQLKQPKLADWPANWKDLAKAEQPDVADYLSQKRSFRGFGKTEKERLLKGVEGAGASSYPDVPFGRFGKQKGVPTNLFTLERATPPVSFPVKRETGMFRLLNISAQEQEKLDKMWGQQMGRVLKERKKGELPSITTRIDDTAETIRGKAKLSFVSEPLRTSPIVFQRQRGLFDTRLSIRKGNLVRGLKPIRDARDYLPDKFAETRKAPKGGKPLDLSPWKLPKIETPKEPNVFFTRQRVGKNILREDTALPNIVPSGILEKQKFTLTKLKLGKGKTDTFGRKFEKSPINSPTKDLSKRTNWDKLASESKKTKEQKDKAWEESQRAPKGGQILVPPEPNPLNLATPEVPIPEAFADVGAKVPFKKDKYKIPLIIPPTPKETKKERPVQTAQVYQEILLSDNRPKISTIQTPRISLAVSQPQKIQESFKINNIQTARIKIAEMTVTKPRQRERQRPKTIQTPKYETIAITRVTPKLRAAQTPKLSSPLAPKAPTKLRAPQRQPLREKPVQVTLLRQTPPRRPPRVIFALPPQKEPKKTKERKEPKQVSGIYLGNVPETQISGIFKRREITLGKEKIAKTRRGDVRVLLGQKRETRRKKKDEYVLGFKVPKAKFF